VWSVLAASLAGLLVAARASAVTASRLVGLYVSVSGSGTLRLTGGPTFTCHESMRQLRPCTRRFDIRRGSRVVVQALPVRGWKLTRWARACNGSSATCSLRLEGRRYLKVTFVPPGDPLNPYRLGQAVRLNNWRLKVNSATLNADARVEAVIDPNTGRPANTAPPAGTQYTLVNMTLTYLGRGSSGGPLEGYVTSHLQTGGFFPHWTGLRTYYAADCKYTPDQPSASNCEAPPIDLGSVSNPIASGQSVTGYACYEIRSRDARWLLLTPNVNVRKNGLGYHGVAFALSR